ncbi:MAG: hypothetical protein IJY47_06825 [Clostridia bacterium]|nr:hypothetical protein [Clostridia bacterium]
MRSKALAKILSGKMLTLIQNIVCVVLIVVMALASFGTIFSMDVDIDSETKASVVDLLNDMKSGDEKIEIPDKIDVSLPFVIRSFGSLADVISAAVDSVKETQENVNKLNNAENLEDAEEALNDLEDSKNKSKDKDLLSQDLVNFIVFFFALIASFKTHWMVGLCNLLLMFLVFILPLVCVIAAIRALIAIITKRNDPGKAFHKIAKALGSIISVFPLLLVVMVMVPQVQFGGAVTGILGMCVAALIVNLVVSRLKYYDKADFTYLNTVQIVSVGSLVAYLIFFTNIIKSDIMNVLFKRLGSYAVKEGAEAIGSAITKTENEPDFLPVLITVLFVILTIVVIKYLSQIVTRIACMSKSKSDSHIVTGVIALITAILPFVLMNHEEFKLELVGDTKNAYTAAVVGLVLLFALEIVMMILSKTLCAASGAERRREIVTGAYIYDGSDEETVAEEAPAEEAPAEAVAEEAPAEEVSAEAVAEEAPAEEVPAEAVAEEAPVEEAPAEEVAEEAPAEETAE